MSLAIVGLTEFLPPLDISTTEYINRVQRGDVDAFDTLFRAYYASLLVFAQAYGQLPVEHAEDIVCEVFGWLWRYRETWQPKTSIEAYLYGAVRNKIQNFTRDSRRDLQRQKKYTAWDESPGTGTGTPIPDAIVEENELQAMIRRYVDELPDTHRLIVLLRWDKQWSWQEIAEALGISSAAAQMQHLRALKTLRERLPGHFTK